MVANISTRGSAESVLGLAVVYTLSLLLSGRLDGAAVLLGFSVHFKLYPVIYGASVLAYLSSPRKGVQESWIENFKDGSAWRRRSRFAAISITTLFVLNTLMYGM